MMWDVSRPPLNYETPRPPNRKPYGIAPYIAFGVCAAMVAFSLLFRDGSSGDRTLALCVGIPSAIGAVVLPIVIAIQTR